MPEIKNTFSQGKMNKDLDERLIPSGQYRDALNVDVTSSEQSDAGTVQNILGNERVENVISHGCECVGSISNELTNKLYWFIKCVGRDAIVEFDQKTNQTSFIVVDASATDVNAPSFLKFTGKQITGINIIDDFLFWTDGESEPKKINISASYQENPNLSLNEQPHSTLNIETEDAILLNEEHITVIRRKPSTAPTVKINSSVGSSNPDIFEKIFPRFCFRYKFAGGEYSAMGPFTDVVFNPKYEGLVSGANAYFTDEPYNKAMSNFIESIDLCDFVPADIPDDVVQVDILYKQENSTVIYSIANIKQSDPEWSADGSNQNYSAEGVISNHKGKYNISTENIHAALPASQMLRPWDNVPKSAVAQEVVGNRICYGNYTQGYDFADDGKPSLKADYEFRGPQNFIAGGLQSLKSQRDYQVGVIFGDKYGRETPVFTSKTGNVKVGWSDSALGQNASSSLMFKTNLTSYLPDWANYYKFYVKQTSSEYYNLIMDKAYIPGSHTGFENPDNHIWISFPSSDRNKIMEDDFIIAKKVYNNSDPQQVDFENKYKVLDIKNDAPEAVRYIFSDLGSANNVGNFLAGNGEDSLFFDDARKIDQETKVIHIKKALWLSGEVDGSPLVTEEAGVVNNEGEATTTADEPVKDVFISWEVSGQHSNRYRVSTVRISNGNIYALRLSKKITSQDAELAASGDNPPQDPINGGEADTTPNITLDSSLIFKIERRDTRSTEDFSGKFFVKIKYALSLTSLDSGTFSDQFTIISTQPSYWLYDEHSSGTNPNNGEFDGIYNSNTSSNIGPEDGDGVADFGYPSQLTTVNPSYTSDNIFDHAGLGYNPSDWADLLTHLAGNVTSATNSSSNGSVFFVDNLPFISSNPNKFFYAKEAGEGWQGATTVYDEYFWGNHISMDSPTGDPNNAAALYVYGWDILPTEQTSMLWSGNQSYIGSSVGGHGLAPRIYAPPPMGIVNGLEGVVTSGLPHINGARQWLNTSIYDQYDTSSFYGTPITGGQTPQGTVNTGFFMHLSFLAPGVDLHDGNIDFNGINLAGSTSIARSMQGIWGGGIFTKTPSVVNSSSDTPIPIESWTNGDDVGFQLPCNWVEFEGNYGGSDGMTGLEDAPGPEIENSWQGYQEEFSDQHYNQWNPEYTGENSENAEIAEFLSNLTTAGSQFVFSGDTSNEVYTILACKKIRLYNHTSWRMRWVWDGSDYVKMGNSVEEAASDWADSWSTNYGQGEDENDPATEAGKAKILKDKIVDFGSRSNRRVCYIIKLDKNPDEQTYNIASQASTVDMSTTTQIQFIDSNAPALSEDLFSYPAIWETEPQQIPELNIYYEASENIPTKIQDNDREIFAPAGCKVEIIGMPNSNDADGNIQLDNETGEPIVGFLSPVEISQDIHLLSWDDEYEGRQFTLYPGLPANDAYGNLANYHGAKLKFTREDGSYVIGSLDMQDFDWSAVEGVDDISIQGNEVSTRHTFLIDIDMNPAEDTGLSWYNCFTFGDGIESNRIRDGFNEMQITNGARASATLEEPYSEEIRKSGLIYSGIYNSDSGVNNLNQFIAAEKITKDLNPTYGSIQKLFTRNTDLIALCEDRVLKILANKDALFNADGNPQLVASGNVLGQAVPFSGDYGISQHPESFAFESYRAYFADKQRGAILRLSMDGLTPISDAGMRDWFRDNLVEESNLLGTYDSYSKQYNITIKPKPFENIIENSAIAGGIEGGDVIDDNPNIISNYAFNDSILYEPSATLATLWAPINEEYNSFPIYNRSIDSITEIRHHHPISQGSIVASVDPQASWIAVDPTFTSYTQGGSYMFNNVFGGDDPNSITNPEDFFHPSVGAGNTSGGQRKASAWRYINGETYEGGNWYAEEPEITHGSEHIYNLLVQDEGIRFVGLLSDKEYSFVWPYWTGQNDAIVSADVDDWVNNPHNVVTNNNGYVSDYSSAQSNTVFNGEEIFIAFRAGSFDATGPIAGDANGEYVNENGETVVGNHARVVIELFDGDVPIQNSQLHYPLDENGDLNLFENTGDGPYASFHEPQASFTPATGAAYMGPQATASVLFPSNQLDGGPWTGKAWFKFTIPDEDGNPTNTEGVAVQDLKVKFSIVTDGIESPNHVTLQNMQLGKTFRLTTPEDPGGPEIDLIDPIPFEYVEGWAEVTHLPPDYWANINNSDLNHGNKDLYGLENPSEVVNGYLLPNPQEGDNAILYNPGADGEEYPSEFEGEGFTLQTENVDGSVQMLDFLGDGAEIKHAFQNDFLFEDNKWYLVDVKVLSEEFAPNISISGAGEGNSDLELFPASIENLGGSYGPSQPGVTHRGIFKVTASSPLLGQTQLGIKTALTGVPVVIDSVVMFDITDYGESGFASDWYTLPSNYTVENILQTPSVYIQQNGLTWNTTVSENKEVIQQFNSSNQPTETADGWGLEFTLLPESGMGDTAQSSGTLTGYVAGPEDIEGNFSGFGFELPVNTLISSAAFKLIGNFNSDSPVELLIQVLVGEPGSGDEYYEWQPYVGDHAAGYLYEQSNRIQFAPGEGGFIGSIYSVKLTDATNYLTPSSIPSWVISGFNPEEQEYITWNDEPDGQIEFNEAPDTALVSQFIGNLQTGDSYILAYDYEITEGEICGYYYNQNGGGFTFTIPPNSVGQQVVTIIPNAIDDADGTPFSETLVIYSCGDKLTATIDDITLTRQSFQFHPQTVSFNEDVRGWVSFKSFIPENGVSLSNQYFTMDKGGLWKHNSGTLRNSFYGVLRPSTITTILNTQPSSIKNFNTISYEGSQAAIQPYQTQMAQDADGNDITLSTMSTYNAITIAQRGWLCEDITTDMQRGFIGEFIEKENKWFNYIRGLKSQVDTSDFNFQGLGIATAVDYPNSDDNEADQPPVLT